MPPKGGIFASLNKTGKSVYTIPEPNKKEEFLMNNINKSIECTVNQCANHSTAGNYCALDRILVGTHECNPTQDQCTDCMSFRKK